MAFVACAVFACAPSPTPVSQPVVPAATRAAFHIGPLSDYVPAGGLRWMVMGRPRSLLKDPELRRAIAVLLPDARFDAFASSAGFDLRAVDQALAAGFDLGTLYLVSLESGQERVARVFEDRLEHEPSRRRRDPRLRLLTGTVHGVPQGLVLCEGEFVGFAVGDPALARVVESYALGDLRSAPALAGAALSTLPRGDAPPLHFLAPGPFEGEWAGGANGLLAAATALSGSVEMLTPEKVTISWVVAGDWRQDGAASALRLVWDRLAESTLGHLLGLDLPLDAPAVSGTDEHLELRVELELPRLVNGLNALLTADVAEMMDLPPPAADGVQGPVSR